MKLAVQPLTIAMALAAWLATAALAQHELHAASGQSAAAARPGNERIWTRQPLLLPGRTTRGERSSGTLIPQGIDAAHVTVFAAEGPAEGLRVDYPVDAAGAKIASVTSKIGNYHWVVAREETPELVKVASTAWYFNNPGNSPKDMLAIPKHELEIVPTPLPRERSRYREAQKWEFQVRFDGKPLPNQPMLMETEFGSRLPAVTDARGVATVVFPRDFTPQVAGAGDERRRAGHFVLTTEKAKDGRRYLTAFNYQYTQDPERNRSVAWGAAFGVLGMVAATPLLRRRKSSTEGGSEHA